jgi:hypothetical protein
MVIPMKRMKHNCTQVTVNMRDILRLHPAQGVELTMRGQATANDWPISSGPKTSLPFSENKLAELQDAKQDRRCSCAAARARWCSCAWAKAGAGD